MVAHDLARREDLIRDFIVAAFKMYGDALVNSEPKMPEIVDLYAMVSRMRVLTMPRSVACAEKVMDSIIETHFRAESDDCRSARDCEGRPRRRSAEGFQQGGARGAARVRAGLGGCLAAGGGGLSSSAPQFKCCHKPSSAPCLWLHLSAGRRFVSRGLGRIERVIAAEIAGAAGHRMAVHLSSGQLAIAVYRSKDEFGGTGRCTLAQGNAVSRAMHSFVRKHQQYALAGGRGRKSLYLYDTADPVSVMWAKLSVKHRRFVPQSEGSSQP
jgi:hypothetical protein